MASYAKIIAGSPSGNLAAGLVGPVGIAIPLTIPTWNTLRVGLRWGVSAFTDFVIDSELAFGLAHSATTNRYWDATCDLFVGVSSKAYSAFDENGIEVVGSGSGCGYTDTRVGSLTNAARAYANWSRAADPPHIFALSRDDNAELFSTVILTYTREGAGQIGVTAFYGDDGTMDDTEASVSTVDFMALMDATTPTRTYYHTTTKAVLPANEGTYGALDAFQLYWGNTSLRLHVDDIRITVIN